jgi:AcrR family transcriptional regulator
VTLARGPGRPDERAERQEKLLDAAVELMHCQATDGLRSLLSLAAVARRAGVSRSSLSRAPDDRDFRDADDLILAVAHERLFTSEGEGVRATYYDVVTEYARAGSPESRFVAAIAANFRAQLRYTTTIPFWQLHTVAATASRGVTSEPAAEADPLAAALCEIRRRYYREVTEQYVGALRTVLADLRRVPREGFDETTIVGVTLTFLNGAVVRHLVDPHAFVDPPETVGHALLAMVLGITVPDDPHLHAGESLSAWVRHQGVAIATALVEDSEAGEGPELRASIVAELWLQVEPESGTDRERLDATFDNEFQSLGALWDSALRALLQRRVEEVWRLRERSAMPVLRMIVENLLAAGDAHPRLVAACAATRGDLDGRQFLDEVEGMVAHLLDLLHAPEPAQWARHLVDDCLRSERARVDLYLKTLPAAN